MSDLLWIQLFDTERFEFKIDFFLNKTIRQQQKIQIAQHANKKNKHTKLVQIMWASLRVTCLQDL